MQYLDTNLVELHYQMPLNEIIYDFFDALKANTKGYASLDYELSGYRSSELVKVDMKLNGDTVDALSFIAHRDKGVSPARRLCEKLKENIPGGCSRCRSRRPLAAGSSPGRPSRPCGRMCWPSAMAATSAARRSCWKSRRRARKDALPGKRADPDGGISRSAQAGRVSPPSRASGPAPRERRQAVSEGNPWSGQAQPARSDWMRVPVEPGGPVGYGKEKMYSLGSVQIPTEVFLAVLKSRRAWKTRRGR